MTKKSEPPDRPAAGKATLAIPLGALALGATAVAVASIIALAIVATVEDADSLATVALVLAILSFLVQLVVYIAQAWTGSQQQVRAEQLNTETRTLLRGIEATANATQRTLTDQYDKVLRAVIDAGSEVASDAEQEPFDEDEFERRVMERVEKKLGGRTVFDASQFSMPNISSSILSEPLIQPGSITQDAIAGLDLSDNFTFRGDPTQPIRKPDSPPKRDPPDDDGPEQ